MAVRAYWKGSLKLSLVSCPVLLYPASTSVEKTRFHIINKETGNRLKQQMVDAETGDVVESDQKGRGYRHCEERSDEAIHSSFAWRDGLLRGACHRARIRATRWLAMTSKRTFAASPRDAPESLMNLPPKEGVGNAGCPLHPRPRVHLVLVERTRVTTSTPESPDIPARNGFNGFLRALVSAKSARMWERAVLTNRPLLDLSPFVLEGL